MALKIKTNIRDLLYKDLKNRISKNKLSNSVLSNIGKELVEDFKASIEVGLSPIQGKGRYEGYKNPTNYPDKIQNKFPNKKRRPVNLILSGDFLRTLIYKISLSNNSITIGFFDKKSQKKEQGHREGYKGQPSRPIIPEGNEKIKSSIISKIKNKLISEYNKII